MLDYTKAALKKTLDDFKIVDYIRNIVTQALYILYLVYAVCTKTGSIWVDIAMLVLCVAYFVFFMIMTKGKPLQPPAEAQKFVKSLFKWCKLLLKFFTLIIMLYGIYFTTEKPTPLSVILSALMIVLWVLQILFEVLVRIITSRAQLLIEGLEADYEELVQPVKSVGNFFKKITGQEVDAPKEKSKRRLWLDRKVDENRAEKKEQKKKEKAEKKEKRKHLKEERKKKKLKAKLDADDTVFLPVEEEPTPSKPQKPKAETLIEEPPLFLETPDAPPEPKKKKKK